MFPLTLLIYIFSGHPIFFTAILGEVLLKSDTCQVYNLGQKTI